MTTLILRENDISDEGAQHLANALQQNKVRQVLYSSITYIILLFDTDIQVEKQQNW
jgi:hypothetical protein